MATPSLQVDLPWGGLAAGGAALSGLGGNPAAAKAQLGPLYQQQYNAALGMNQALYSGAQQGYEGLRSSVDRQYQDVLGGYQQLYGDVLGRIAGSNASNIMDIDTNAAAQSGRASQDMVSRGLGNSTVQQNMQRAISLDRARAITDSENRFAQLGANYASNIGQNRLQAQQQGIGLGANLGQAQLGMLERVNAGYPDAGMYGSLAQMYGAQEEAEKNRLAQRDALNAASRGQFSTPGTSSPASPFGKRPFDNGGASFEQMSQYRSGAGGWGGGGGGGGYRLGEGFNGTPALNYDSGYGSMYQDNIPAYNSATAGSMWNQDDIGGGDFGLQGWQDFGDDAIYGGTGDGSGYDYWNTASAADLGLSDYEWDNS